MDLVCERNGVVLHAVVQLCSVRIEISGDEPVGAALHFRRTGGDPELHTDEAYGWYAKKKADNEWQVIANQRDVGVEVRWIHLTFSLPYLRERS
jgi:hypothetical protein